MAEFDLLSFVFKLKEFFADSKNFPYMANEYTKGWVNQNSSQKHPNRSPAHLRDEAKSCMARTQVIAENTITFDYGDANMEKNYPHYHILQQAPVIRKKNKSTKKTRGSQGEIVDKAMRDYENVMFGGKIGSKLFKEYSRNVRGARNRANNVSYWKDDVFQNSTANSYANIHYKYIDNILDNEVVPKLASEFNLKAMRKQDNGLTEELALQWDTDESTILDIMSSFN